MRRSRDRPVTASDLAQMGVCEKRVLLQARLGKRTSPLQDAAIKRGRLAHRRFHAKAFDVNRHVESTDARPGPCFIATALFGEGPETTVLRAFRDRYLRTTDVGRRFVAFYDRFGPLAARAVQGRPWARAVGRALLRRAVALANRILISGKQ